MVRMVPVYEFLLADDQLQGCGTQAEFEHWTAEGTMPTGSKLGRVLCHEPATEDARRSVLWAAEMKKD